MTTATPTPAEIAAMERAYSLDYQMARAKFLEAAAAAGGEIQHHLVLRSGTVDYYMDTAFFPGAKGKKMLVHASGTHGVEGYTGSAIQVKLLEEWDKEKAQAGPSVLFVHAINPYGMAHYRRFNENNVDLNRNFHTPEEWKDLLARDPNVAHYEDFRYIFSPDEAPTKMDYYTFLPRIAMAAAKAGGAALKGAMVTGQYHHPEGLFFGGKEEQDSIKVLRKVLSHYAASGLEDAIFLDVHTGLGPMGVDTIMCSHEQDAIRARQCFPDLKVQNDAAAEEGPSAAYSLVRGVIRPRMELGGAHVMSVTEEFGTVSGLYVARALVIENAAYHHCRGSLIHESARIWLRDVFYPQSQKYKVETIVRGRTAFWNCIKFLS